MSLAVLALVDEDSVDRLGVTVRISGGDIWGGRTSLGFHRTWASLLPGVAGDRRFRGRVGVALRA